MRFQSLVLILVVLFASTATNQANFVDVNDPHVIEVATFAVTEYNNQHTEAKLVFEKVISGVSNVADNGTRYSLTLSANNNGSASNNYDTIVLEKSSENFSLIAFALVPHA
jgi:hypothetical protein